MNACKVKISATHDTIILLVALNIDRGLLFPLLASSYFLYTGIKRAFFQSWKTVLIAALDVYYISSGDSNNLGIFQQLRPAIDQRFLRKIKTSEDKPGVRFLKLWKTFLAQKRGCF